MNRRALALALITAACFPGAATGAVDEQTRESLLTVNGSRIAGADREPGNWLSHGRTYSEQRFSPLAQVDADNVDELGLAWFFELPTRRGQEATPLAVDDVLYVTGSWSMVFALDARSGEELWRYDPAVPRSTGKNACCDAVNRGVAVWEGKVFFGTLDGRLIALDAITGDKLWERVTVDQSKPYTITGAPRVVKNKVIIGNGGAEYGVRGYVSAYDVDTGEMIWRFYTVPGNPADGFESAALERAAGTWTGEWWKLGGGGTVWDSMAYDPELDLLYVGVGNGSPWNRKLRSPGGGDNLFLSSIVALRPDTGEYVWHYQTTPADNWDFTATQHMILAELEIGGERTPVIMQAPKNGFFYVLDRRDGRLISAENFVPVNWASHVDQETGRPVETIDSDYQETPRLTFPSAIGAHNWQPMSYSPLTGLVYIPAMEVPATYGGDLVFPRPSAYWQTGTDLSIATTPMALGPDIERSLIRRLIKSYLLAWDPVRQRAVWRVAHEHPWNGGVLSTAGGLVFQGDAMGFFSAYRASDGERLWQAPANNGIVAAPISYEVDGDQYVAVLAGWGGSLALHGGAANDPAVGGATGRLLVYRLGAAGQPPPGPAPLPAIPEPPELTADDELGTPERLGVVALGERDGGGCRSLVTVEAAVAAQGLRRSASM
ncbi:MAG: PQQ-dependent dehydrogenase, methanol/ethanol family [Gammaproteobacteria bacterium]